MGRALLRTRPEQETLHPPIPSPGSRKLPHRGGARGGCQPLRPHCRAPQHRQTPGLHPPLRPPSDSHRPPLPSPWVGAEVPAAPASVDSNKPCCSPATPPKFRKTRAGYTATISQSAPRISNFRERPHSGLRVRRGGAAARLRPKSPAGGRDKTQQGRDGGMIGGAGEERARRATKLEGPRCPDLTRRLGRVSCGTCGTSSTSGERNVREGHV